MAVRVGQKGKVDRGVIGFGKFEAHARHAIEIDSRYLGLTDGDKAFRRWSQDEVFYLGSPPDRTLVDNVQLTVSRKDVRKTQ